MNEKTNHYHTQVNVARELLRAGVMDVNYEKV